MYAGVGQLPPDWKLPLVYGRCLLLLLLLDVGYNVKLVVQK